MTLKSKETNITLITIFIFFLTITSAFADMGKLKKIIHTGNSGGWYGQIDSDNYWLENVNQPGAIRYYHTAYSPEDAGNRLISVRVKLETNDPQARAGLFYGYDDKDRSYYLILLGPNGIFEVIRRDASGFHLRMSSTTGAVGTAFNQIIIRENGNNLSLSVNGKDMGSFGNDTVGKGAVGIVAVGMGRFGYSKYSEQANRHSQIKPGTKSLPDKSGPVVHGNQKTHIVRDEFGFEKPYEALTLTLPEGWDVRGAVQWYGRPGCNYEGHKFHFMATAPDGKQWVEFLPGGVWGWNSLYDANPQLAQQGLAGCDAKNIRTIRAFVDQYIPQIRPGARITSMRMRPDFAQQALSETIKNFQRRNQTMRPRPEAMEVRISYQANGRTINEMLAPVILFLDQPAVDIYGGMSGYLTVAMALGTMTTATVDGPADENLMDFVGENMKLNPDYLARLKRHYHEKENILARANARRHAASQAYYASRRNNWKVDKTGSEILDIQMNTYKSKNKMNDAGHARSIDMIHERKPWQNTYGQTIYMPQQYQRVYQLPNGVYAGTNDPFFNPVQSFGEFGTPLQPVR